MTSLKFEALDYVYQKMNALVGKYHPEVADIYDQIAIIFTEKTSKSGGKFVFCKVSKASSDLQLLGKKQYLYIIHISAEAWDLMDESQHEATLDRCLCSIKQTYDEKSEDIKYSLKKPDIIVFKDELCRHGYWWKDIETQLEEKYKKEDDDEDDNQRMTSPTQPANEVQVEDMLTEIAEN